MTPWKSDTPKTLGHGGHGSHVDHRDPGIPGTPDTCNFLLSSRTLAYIKFTLPARSLRTSMLMHEIYQTHSLRFCIFGAMKIQAQK